MDRGPDRHILLEIGEGAPFSEVVETDVGFYQGSSHIIVLELATSWVLYG